MPDEDDQSLMRAIALGDREAFGTLVTRHRHAAWRAIRARVRDDGAADDALQETFLGVWRGAGAWRGDAEVRPWILAMARNQAARTWRRRAGAPEHTTSIEQLGIEAGFGSVDPERAVSALEDVARVHEALASLPPEDREILALRDLEQLTLAETAAHLDLTLAATKSRLHRARLRLMAALRVGGDP